jgi:hypothetical protein
MITIDAALRNPDLLGAGLGDASTWGAWLTILSAAFADPLGDGEEAVEFAKLAGGRAPPVQRVSELWAIAGRRSGKSRVASAVAVYLALFQRHALAAGEVGHVLCLSASKAQAELIRSYCLAFVEQSPVLRSQVRKVTAEEITLANGVVIGVHTSNFRTLRGRTILACVLDEAAFFRDETSATPDVEVYRAVKPALDASGGMLIGISSPYRKTGLLATRHRDHYGKNSDVLVIQAPTLALNPTIAESVVITARAEDPASAKSEWDAEFRTDLSSLLADDVIDRAIDHDRPPELHPLAGIRYKGFVDASAGRHDAFTLCIGHATGQGDDQRFVADVVRGMSPPFDPRSVAVEFAELARAYGINELVGDAFAGLWVENAFRDAGISYHKSELPKSALYLEGLSTFNRGRVALPDDPKLIRELRTLERRTHRSGRDSVDHPRNGSDDLANVVFGAMWLTGIAGTLRRGSLSVSHIIGGRVVPAKKADRPSALKGGAHQTASANRRERTARFNAY